MAEGSESIQPEETPFHFLIGCTQDHLDLGNLASFCSTTSVWCFSIEILSGHGSCSNILTILFPFLVDNGLGR